MPVYKGKPTKDGRMYYFICSKDGIKHCSKMFATRKEAKEKESVFLLQKGKYNKVRFTTLAEDYFENLRATKKESTYYGHYSLYKAQIMPVFERLYIDSINIPFIENWKKSCQKKGYSIKYLQKAYIILNSILKRGKLYGYDNPMELVPQFEEPKEKVQEDKLRYMTYDEFQKFISVVDDPEWYAFFYFLFFTGMRKGEVQALSWNDISNNTILVNKTLSVKTQDLYKITTTKNNLVRTITMNKSLQGVMNDYYNIMKSKKDFSKDWFVFGGPRFLPQTTIDRAKHKYFVKSGVREITIHEFRHSNVSMLVNEYIKSGQTDTTKFFIMMSQRLGHSIPVMQKTYLHLFPSVQNEIIDILDNL